jgi:hypothetical protein
MDALRDLGGDTTLFTELLSGESRNVDPETVEDWRNSHYCKEQKVVTTVIYIKLTRPVYFSTHILATLSLFKIFTMVV